MARYRRYLSICIVLFWVLASCSPAPRTEIINPPATGTLPVSATNTATAAAPQLDSPKIQTDPGLSDDEFATLSSLTKVSSYPLYTMHYTGEYGSNEPALNGETSYTRDTNSWACSLFAAFADPQSQLFGRNFDWQYSPALLLFTSPPDGYSSVSMVDIGYLVDSSVVGHLDEVPVTERLPLLESPYWPFDGMNERGLAIGMAAVPPGNVPPDPDKETIDSLMVMRLVLDHAQNVDEAVQIIEKYNIDFAGGPPLHYLIADQNGNAMLVEFSQGKIVLIPNETPWHVATNFLRSEAGDWVTGTYWRYDTISQKMAETGGRLQTTDAIDLLSEVAQATTQWSIVYGINDGEISVAMNKQYDQVFTFSIK